MDRSAFLNSLPFLWPSSWPDDDESTTPHTNQKSNPCNTTTLHHNDGKLFLLSIEPILLLDDDSSSFIPVGPVLTTTTTSLKPPDEDPCMCTLELVVTQQQQQHCKLSSPSMSSASTSLSISPHNTTTNTTTLGHPLEKKSPESLRSSSRTPSQSQHTHETPTSHSRPPNKVSPTVWVRLDRTHTYQVDLVQLESLQLCQASPARVPRLGQSSQTPAALAPPHASATHIPCLLLHFSGCLWRIFCNVEEEEEASPKDEDSPLLILAQQLSAAMKQPPTSVATKATAEVGVPNTESTGQLSPSTTSQPKSADTPQIPNAATKPPPDHPSHSSTTTTTALQLQQGKQKDEPSARRQKRRHASIARTMQGLQSIRTLLSMPASSFPTNNTDYGLGPLLTATAEEGSASYYRAADGARATADAARAWQEAQDDLEGILGRAFPPPRQKQRRLLTAAVASPAPSDPGVPRDLRATAEQLVQRQKEIVNDKYRLFLLPKRG